MLLPIKTQKRLWACLPVLCLLLAGCSQTVFVESSNYSSRVDYVVIHATSEDFAESLRLLTQPTENPVSSHYLIPAPDDPSYPRRALRVYQLVPELERAWHAGRSYWAGEESLNDRSIGIEVVNEFSCEGTESPIEETDPDSVRCIFPPFADEQIEALAELLLGILERYPDIDPIDVVAHSDIAILRKSDPGPLFPWQLLYERGVGAWFDEQTYGGYADRFRNAMPPLPAVQQALAALGYQLEVTGSFDRQTQFAMRAFQLHFRPADYRGGIDLDSVARLWALLAKYRSEELQEVEAGWSGLALATDAAASRTATQGSRDD